MGYKGPLALRHSLGFRPAAVADSRESRVAAVRGARASVMEPYFGTRAAPPRAGSPPLPRSGSDGLSTVRTARYMAQTAVARPGLGPPGHVGPGGAVDTTPWPFTPASYGGGPYSHGRCRGSRPLPVRGPRKRGDGRTSALRTRLRPPVFTRSRSRKRLLPPYTAEEKVGPVVDTPTVPCSPSAGSQVT